MVAYLPEVGLVVAGDGCLYWGSFFSVTFGADLSLRRCSNTVVCGLWAAYLSREASVAAGLATSGSLEADLSLL